MMEDYLEEANQNFMLCYHYLMVDLDRRFKASNHRMIDYGIPEPESRITELEYARLQYDKSIQLNIVNELVGTFPFTDEMQSLFNEILDGLRNSRQEYHVLQGQGGSGKSTFVKALMAYVRSEGFIAVGCASKGLAANVYDDFFTTHSLFGIPVLDDEEFDP